MDPKKALVIDGLKKNLATYGKLYCPRVPSYMYSSSIADDLICPCKEYRETDHCLCGLYDKPYNR